MDLCGRGDFVVDGGDGGCVDAGETSGGCGADAGAEGGVGNEQESSRALDAEPRGKSKECNDGGTSMEASGLKT